MIWLLRLLAVIAFVGFGLSFAYEASLESNFVTIQFTELQNGATVEVGQPEQVLAVGDIQFLPKKTANKTRFAGVGEKGKVIPKAVFIRVLLFARIGCILAVLAAWLGGRLLRPSVVDTSPRTGP